MKRKIETFSAEIYPARIVRIIYSYAISLFLLHQPDKFYIKQREDTIGGASVIKCFIPVCYIEIIDTQQIDLFAFRHPEYRLQVTECAERIGSMDMAINLQESRKLKVPHTFFHLLRGRKT